MVINTCYGGFSLSDKAYERLIELGIPARKYIQQERDPSTGLYKRQPLNEGEVIFDRELTPEGEDESNDLYYKFKPNSITGRYWETWLGTNRSHPLLVKVVEELGEDANTRYSKLKVVEVPDGVDYTIEEYDGLEHIAEVHRTWA